MAGRTERTSSAAGPENRTVGGIATIDWQGRVRSVDAGLTLLLDREADALVGETLATLEDRGLVEVGTASRVEAELAGAKPASPDTDRVSFESVVSAGADGPGRPVRLTLDSDPGREVVRLDFAETGPDADAPTLLSAIQEGVESVSHAPTGEAVLAALARAAVSVLGVSGVEVRAVDGTGEDLRRVVGQTLGPTVDERDVVTTATCPYEDVLTLRETVLPAGPRSGVRDGYDGVAILPIAHRGTLAVGRVGRPISDTDVDALRVLRDHAKATLHGRRWVPEDA